MRRLVLASGSPRRRELLTSSGIRFRVSAVQIDETPGRESPQDYVRRLALQKAKSCKHSRTEIVLAADTTVVLKGRILGKPSSRRESISMLCALSGKTHKVLTGYCLLVPRQRPILRVVTTLVTFRLLTKKEILTYVRTGEPADKAGAYAAQGRGMILLSKVRGSYTNVIGLPMGEVLSDLKQHGYC